MVFKQFSFAVSGNSSRQPSRAVRLLVTSAITAFALVVAGCGGGGSSGPGPSGSTGSTGTGVPTSGSGVTGTVPAQASATLKLLAGTDGGIGYRDGAAATALFSDIVSVASDDSGNLYVADYSNNVVRKIDGSGNVTTYAGAPGRGIDVDGPAASAQFAGPSGIAVDPSGNVFVTERATNVVREITTAGQVITLAGVSSKSGSSDGVGAAALFNGPGAITSDSNGNVFLSDSNGLTIRMVTPAGAVTTIFGSAGQSSQATGNSADAQNIEGLAFDASNNLFFIDGLAFREIPHGGGVSTIVANLAAIGSPSNTTCDAVSLARSGNGFVALAACNVINLSSTGVESVLYTYTTNYISAAIAADHAGNVYVPYDDGFQSVLDVIAPTGAESVFAGEQAHYGDSDGAGTQASFGYSGEYPGSYEGGIASDSAGNLYVADTANNTIRKITAAGVVSTLAGSAQFDASGNAIGAFADGQGVTARFNGPFGIAVNSAGLIFVADAGNQRIRQITPAGLVTTFAGSPNSSPQRVDGTGTSAKFSVPMTLAIDGAGNLYVGDQYSTKADGNEIAPSNGTVLRKITPAGFVSTIAGSSSTEGDVDGPVSSAQFDSISGIAIDPVGHIFVSDNGNIREISNGVVTTVFTPSKPTFFNPVGLAIDAKSNLYFADPYTQIIGEIDASGSLTTYAGTSRIGASSVGPLPGSLSGPYALVIYMNGLAVTMRGAVATIQ